MYPSPIYWMRTAAAKVFARAWQVITVDEVFPLLSRWRDESSRLLIGFFCGGCLSYQVEAVITAIDKAERTVTFKNYEARFEMPLCLEDCEFQAGLPFMIRTASPGEEQFIEAGNVSRVLRVLFASGDALCVLEPV